MGLLDFLDTIGVDQEAISQISGMLEENRVFVEVLRSGSPPPTTWRDGYRATLMVLKAFEAIRSGAPQEISLSEIS